MKGKVTKNATLALTLLNLDLAKELRHLSTESLAVSVRVKCEKRPNYYSA